MEEEWLGSLEEHGMVKEGVMGWIMFGFGLSVGACVGLVLAGLLRAGKDTDKMMDDEYREHEGDDAED
uniref:Uncharacterized protein n=2 Tax=viral metagenome TaxID=1070528 RepID=A0A6M3JRG7_9ZZZZ